MKMSELIEKFEGLSGLQEAIQVGKTLIVGNLRIRRYADALKVMDLKNAGKKGKMVDLFSLNDLDYVTDPKTKKAVDKFMGQIVKVKSYGQAKKMAKAIVDDQHKRYVAGEVEDMIGPKFFEAKGDGGDIKL